MPVGFVACVIGKGGVYFPYELGAGFDAGATSDGGGDMFVIFRAWLCMTLGICVTVDVRAGDYGHTQVIGFSANADIAVLRVTLESAHAVDIHLFDLAQKRVAKSFRILSAADMVRGAPVNAFEEEQTSLASIRARRWNVVEKELLQASFVIDGSMKPLWSAKERKPARFHVAALPWGFSLDCREQRPHGFDPANPSWPEWENRCDLLANDGAKSELIDPDLYVNAGSVMERNWLDAVYVDQRQRYIMLLDSQSAILPDGKCQVAHCGVHVYEVSAIARKLGHKKTVPDAKNRQ